MERRIDQPNGHVNVREACFLTHESLAELHAFIARTGAPAEQVSRLLAAAVDEDNYRRDMWIGHLAGHNLRFHLSRIRVELRDIAPEAHLR